MLRLLAMGYTLQETANKLGKSRETTKSQIRTARARLKAKTMTHAVALAISYDLI